VATSTEEYMRRNYANNVSEYNTVIGSLVQQRRYVSPLFAVLAHHLFDAVPSCAISVRIVL
jgi:hypothetical protein